MYFRDRSLVPGKKFNPDGTPNYLFPRKRVCIWAGDVLLFDGPSRYWDGLYPVEFLDWGIETDHPFGESEVDLYRGLQEAVNLLISGLVDNSRLINDPPKIIGPGVSPDVEEDIEQNFDRPGRTWRLDSLTDVVPQPPGAMSQVVVATLGLLKDGIEFLSGLSEATAGKRPPGISSGIMLDALLMAAQIVIRLQGRAVEDFVARAGRLLTSRVIQGYDGQRVKYALQANGEVLQAIWEREQFIQSLEMKGSEEEVDRALQELHRDMVFMVQPMSSLAATKAQEYLKMRDLYQMGLVDGLAVLEAADIVDPTGMLKRAQDDLQRRMLAAMAAKLGMGGRGGRGGRGNGKAERTPAARMGGVGAEGGR